MAGKDPQKSPFLSPFPWFADGNSRVQMNPLSALAKSDSQKKLLVSSGGLVLLAIFGFMLMQSLQKQQQSSVNANVNLQKSLVGIVENVQTKENSFILKYQSSLDKVIQTSGVSLWLVRLPPGEDIATGKTLGTTCYSLPDVTQYAALVTPANCRDILVSGKRVLVEYLVIRTSNTSLVARTIVGEILK